MIKVSVCIPIYNVEQYIEKCARSLFEQTLREIEFIFVNDCTPDKSIEILKKTLEDYPERKSQVTIIDHPKNYGIGQTRITALEYLKNSRGGGFITHCDSDDYIEKAMYEKMYNAAVAADADIVYCDYIREYQNSTEIKKRQGGQSENVDDFINECFSKTGICYLWNKLVRREIALLDYTNYCPSYISYLEDLLRMTAMLKNSKKIIHYKEYLYHYRIRKDSITRKLSSSESVRKNLFAAIAVLDANFTEDKYQYALDYRRRLALYTAIGIPDFPAKQWHSLYKRAKRGILNDNKFSLPTKLIFIIAMANFRCGQLAYRIMRNVYLIYLKIRSALSLNGCKS